jgi:hypothetical protein
MTMATVARVKQFDTVILERAEERRARRKFSLRELLTIIGFVAFFPIVFPIMMWSAHFQDKKLEQTGFYDQA